MMFQLIHIHVGDFKCNITQEAKDIGKKTQCISVGCMYMIKF